MESIQSTIIYLALFTSAASAIGTMFLVYNHFRNPDISASKRLSIIETTCPIKHKTLDEAVTNIQKGLDLIKENHLRHIEGDISKINEKMAAQTAQLEMMTLLMKDVLNRK